MKDNLISYIQEYGNKTFLEKPLCDADFLAFSQFVYIKFDGYVGGTENPEQRITIRRLSKIADRDELFMDERFREDNEKLFDAMAASRRYGRLVLSHYTNNVDLELETQFSAMTLSIGPKTTIVLYRGTDETLVGWKEDFNLAFWDKVPAQAMSEGYFRGIAADFPGRLYLSGHSKGGHLAIYAAMSADEEVRSRIEKVYSFDGPGFRPDILVKRDYAGIRSKIRKLIPQSSLIGMLLENQEDYQVVSSAGIGVGQHNPFKWRIVDGNLVELDELMPGSKYMDRRLNEWIRTLSQEQVKIFTETLYQVVCASNADSLLDFSDATFEKIGQMVSAYKNLDPEVKEQMQVIMKALFHMKNTMPVKWLEIPM